MEGFREPEIKVETVRRTILVTDARDSSRAYFSERAGEALARIERDRALFAQIAERHGGEEVRDRGDGSMFAFLDPLEGMRAALEMQKEVRDRNAAISEGGLRLEHRMGIHTGEIKLATTRLLLHGEETFRRKLSGDLAVVAARLEGICHPGEVCLSSEVYRFVKGRIEHPFRFLDATFKGLNRPMRLWSTRLDPDWERPLTAEEEGMMQRRKEERRLREKWEREQRDRRRYWVALRVSSVVAGFAIVAAGVSYLYTGFALQERTKDAWGAFFAPRPETKPYVPPPNEAPPPRVAQKDDAAPENALPRASRTPRRSATPVARKRGSRAQVAGVLRSALVGGRYDDVPVRLAALNLSSSEYQSLCDHARRMERTRDWFAARLQSALGDETQGIALDPEVAGFATLTGAGDASLKGLDGDDRPRTRPYSSLAPRDLARLLAAASGDDADELPDTPQACAQSLSALQRRIRG